MSLSGLIANDFIARSVVSGQLCVVSLVAIIGGATSAPKR